MIVVLPKGTPDGQEGASIAGFLDLVAVAHGLTPPEGPVPAGWASAGPAAPWPLLVGWWYLRALEGLVRHDLRKGYVQRSEVLVGHVRGRMDPARHATLALYGRAHHMPCTWDAYDLDTWDNRILKAAARAVDRRSRILEPVVSRPDLLPLTRGWVRDALDTVADVPIPPQRLTGPLPRTDAHRYPPALGLARMVLRSAGSTNAGDLDGWTIDANKVFESLAARVVEKVAANLGLTASWQGFGAGADASDHLMRRDGSPRTFLQPDLVLRRGARVVAVGDAKYKQLFGQDDGGPRSAREAADRLDTIHTADLYQLFTYLRAARCPAGFFVVPFRNASGPAALLDERWTFAVSPIDGVDVGVAALGLNLAAPASRLVEEAVRVLSAWVATIAEPCASPTTARAEPSRAPASLHG